MIQSYIAYLTSEYNENVRDNLKHFWFDKTLEQAMKYTYKDKTKFDLISAWGLTEIGAQSLKKEALKETLDSKFSLLDYAFPKYNNGERLGPKLKQLALMATQKQDVQAMSPIDWSYHLIPVDLKDAHWFGRLIQAYTPYMGLYLNQTSYYQGYPQNVLLKMYAEGMQPESYYEQMFDPQKALKVIEGSNFNYH